MYLHYLNVHSIPHHYLTLVQITTMIYMSPAEEVSLYLSIYLSIYLFIYMYTYHFVYLNIFIFIFLHTVLPSCDGSLFQYQNTSYFYFANGTRVRTGRVEVCVDGTYIPVCANGLNSSLLSQSRSEELNGICKIIMSYCKLI